MPTGIVGSSPPALGKTAGVATAPATAVTGGVATAPATAVAPVDVWADAAAPDDEVDPFVDEPDDVDVGPLV
jgi:hypothetical protein